jgi:hypothetical protein
MSLTKAERLIGKLDIPKNYSILNFTKGSISQLVRGLRIEALLTK